MNHSRSALTVGDYRLSGVWLAFWGLLVALLGVAFAVRPGLFVDQAVGGLVYGMILVLVALGLSIILGLLGVVNFAHGALFMLGAYLTFQVMSVWGLPFVAALVLVPIAVGVVGLLMERLVLQHVYEENPLVGFLATFGLALMLEDVIRAVWGGTPLSVQIPTVLSSGVDLAVTTVARFRLFTVLLAALTVLAVYLLIDRTDFGLSIRAGVLDREMAAFLGVNMPIRFVFVFFLGTAIAGLGGVLRGTGVIIDVGMGQSMVILAFVVVVVGGVGSLFGSVVAGFLIGEAIYLTPTVLRSLSIVTGVGAIDVPAIGGLMPYLVMIFVLLALAGGQMQIPAVTDHVQSSLDLFELFDLAVTLDESGPLPVVQAPGIEG